MKLPGHFSIGVGCLLAAFLALGGCESPKAQRSSTELAPIHYNYIYLFANYEGYRFPQTTTIERAVPSALLRNGIVQIY